MKKTRILVGLIIILMIGGLFVLTGCGEKKEEINQTSEETSETPVDTSNALVQATEFYIQNTFPNDTTVTEVYATVTGMDSWTPNLISGLQLAPGTRSKIGLGLTEGTTSWDFKLVDSEGTAVTFSSVDLSNIITNTASTVDFTVDSEGNIAANVK